MNHCHLCRNFVLCFGLRFLTLVFPKWIGHLRIYQCSFVGRAFCWPSVLSDDLQDFFLGNTVCWLFPYNVAEKTSAQCFILCLFLSINTVLLLRCHVLLGKIFIHVTDSYFSYSKLPRRFEIK